jgi:hypothetical protein
VGQLIRGFLCKAETTAKGPIERIKIQERSQFNESQDQHEGRQRNVGQLISMFLAEDQNDDRVPIKRSKNFRRGANPMKVKTNTKAGNALWGG